MFRIFSENLGLKFFSLILALFLWLVVLGSQNVEVVKEIPLEVTFPKELVSSIEIPETVRVRISGPKAFLRTIMDRKEDPFRVNMSSSIAGRNVHRFSPAQISLPLGVRVVGMDPPELNLRLDPVKTRDISVKLEFIGSLPEGFQIIEKSLTPQTVRVRGTELRVKRIKEVLSMPIDLTDLKQGFERKLALDLEGLGVTVEGELPSLNLEIRATSANFRIRNVKIKVIGNSRASITDRFKTATVLVRVSPQDLKKLDVDQVEASVDVSSMSAGVYKPKVHVKLPKAIGIVRIVPDVVEVKVP